MTHSFQKTTEWRDVNAAMFRNEIVPRNEPAVLKGLIRDWPAVQVGLSSAVALGAYLKSFDRGSPVDTLIGDAAILGHFFYRDDMSGLNFERKAERIGASIERLLAHVDAKSPPAIFIQAAALPDCLPEFSRDNAIDLLNPSVTPRIWIGNAVTVATHFDFNENIACVVGGRRRFTFFPPEQLQNLYAGPFEFTPAGIPVSMVNLEEPDFAKYPRFRQALATARQAELEAGDAVYIP